MKKYMLSIFFLFAIHLHSDTPAELLTVLVYRGEVCSVVINVNVVECDLSILSAQKLTGTGNNTYYLGNLTMYLFNNSGDTPYKLDLLCNTYDTSDNTFIAKHDGSSDELKIGVQKAFNLEGERDAYAFITPTSDTTLLRQSNSTICQEQHTLYFYIMESPENIFIAGTYTAKFVLFFES